MCWDRQVTVTLVFVFLGAAQGLLPYGASISDSTFDKATDYSPEIPVSPSIVYYGTSYSKIYVSITHIHTIQNQLISHEAFIFK